MDKKDIGILIACEFSGRVREEFIKLGFTNTWSCDLLDTEIQSNPGRHIKGDVLDWIDLDWKLIIAFPPCTDLAASGAKHFERKRKNGQQQKSIDFFMEFTEYENTKYWAIENPVGIMSNVYRKPDQIIQPFWFGDNARKTTCLWLNNLPKLVPTEMVSLTEDNFYVQPDGRKRDKSMSNLTKKDRAKNRSRTFSGIAKAMATQWGEFIYNELNELEKDEKSNKGENK